jgi:argininosuccinate synthase
MSGSDFSIFTIDFGVVAGFWFSPECEFVRESIALTQRHVTGWVQVQLYKGSGELQKSTAVKLLKVIEIIDQKLYTGTHL